MESIARSQPDFRKIFEKGPGLFIVLDTNFSIVAVSDANASGVANLKASLNRVGF